jgi:hypothetical protein
VRSGYEEVEQQRGQDLSHLDSVHAGTLPMLPVPVVPVPDLSEDAE